MPTKRDTNYRVILHCKGHENHHKIILTIIFSCSRLTYCWAQSAFLYNNINLGSQTSLFVFKTAKEKNNKTNKKSTISRAAIQHHVCRAEPFPQLVIDF